MSLFCFRIDFQLMGSYLQSWEIMLIDLIFSLFKRLNFSILKMDFSFLDNKHPIYRCFFRKFSVIFHLFIISITIWNSKKEKHYLKNWLNDPSFFYILLIHLNLFFGYLEQIKNCFLLYFQVSLKNNF